jgi:hypothetical protein
LIDTQLTRGITLGVAALAAAMSTGASQVAAGPEPAGPPPAAPFLASERLEVVPRLEAQRGEGVIALQQARQAAQGEGGSLEAAAQAPPRSGRSSPAAAGSQSAAPAPANYGSGSIQDIIVSAFTPYGPGAVQWGLRVARCESGYNPGAVNSAGPYYGLFQFLVSTFKATPYGGQNILDPAANANAAAWKYSHGGAGAWGCR